MKYVTNEAAVVNDIVPDPLQPSMHAHHLAFIRLRAWRWQFNDVGEPQWCQCEELHIIRNNNWIHKVNINDANASNYILCSSNNQMHKAILNDTNASNYVSSSSDALIHKTNLND